MALASEFARPDISRAGDINWHQPHAPIPFRHKTLEMGKTLANRGQTNLLCSLPPELLIRIAEHATTSTHSNLSRTCQYLAFILQPELFQRSNADGMFTAMAYGCSHWDSNAVIRHAIVHRVPPDVHSYFANGNTPLCLASFHGCLTAVGYLLKQGVDPNVAGAHELSPLGHALRGLLELLESDYRAWLGLQKGEMPASLRYVKTIVALLDAGADPHCKLPEDFIEESRRWRRAIKLNALSVVLTACQNYQLSGIETETIIRKLVSLGVSPHAEAVRIGAQFRVVTILEWAVERYCGGFCRLDLVKLLVEHGANINYFDTGFRKAKTKTVLGLAIQHHKVTLVGYLMTGSKRALRNILPDMGISPLCWAIMVGNPETVLVVLKAGTSRSKSPYEWRMRAFEYCPTEYCRTVLGQAVYRQGRAENKDKILEYLIRWNANPNERDSEGRRPLGEALREDGWNPTHHRPYMVKLLLKHGAGPNLPSKQWNKGEQLPLEQAITNCWKQTSGQRQEIVEMLLDAGADPNARSPNMGTRTCLMVALKSCWEGYQGDGDLKIIRSLYQQEKRRCAKVLGLRTRISLAKTAEVRQGTGFASKIVLMLLRKGATVSYSDMDV